MRFGWEDPDDKVIFWFGLWGAILHDNGLSVINRRRVHVFESRAPNTGYRRKWWHRS